MISVVRPLSVVPLSALLRVPVMRSVVPEQFARKGNARLVVEKVTSVHLASCVRACRASTVAMAVIDAKRINTVRQMDSA